MECKCLSEPHTKDFSWDTAPQSRGINDGCVEAKAMPPAPLPLRGGHQGDDADQDLRTPSSPLCMRVKTGLFFLFRNVGTRATTVRIVQDMWPQANEKKFLTSWHGDSILLSYCLVQLFAQMLRNEGNSRKCDHEPSGLQM